MRSTQDFIEQIRKDIVQLGSSVKSAIYDRPFPSRPHILAPNFKSKDQEDYGQMWLAANQETVEDFKSNEDAIRSFEASMTAFYEQFIFSLDPEAETWLEEALASVKDSFGPIFEVDIDRMVSNQEGDNDEDAKKNDPVVDTAYLDNDLRNFNLAFYLYALCAKHRRNIAAELNQDGDGIFRPKKYGLFVDKNWGTPHDLVSPYDTRFGKYYAPLKKGLISNLSNSGELEFNCGGAPLMPTFVVALPITGKHPIKCETYFEDSLSTYRRQMYQIPSKIPQNSPFVIMVHGNVSDIREMFSQVNLHLGETLRLDNENPVEKLTLLYYHLANIMYYLGNIIPLKAGSAATTENFIQCILKKINLPPAVYQSTQIPWYFLCKVTSREQFIRIFPRLLSRPLIRLDTLQISTAAAYTSSSALFTRVAKEQGMHKMHDERNNSEEERERFDCRYGIVPR